MQKDKDRVRPRQTAASLSEGRPPPARRRKRWLLAGLAVCVAVTAFFGVKHFRDIGGWLTAGSQPSGAAPQDGRAGPAPAPVPAPPAPPTPSAPATGPQPDAPIDDLKEEAFAVVRQLMADFPRYSDPLGMMGMLYNRFEDPDEAQKWWNKCLERNPRRADVYVAQAQAATLRGDFEKGAALWRKAQEIAPRMPGVHSGYAATLLELGKADEALDALEKEAGISPNDSRCHVLMARAYAQRKEYQKAVDHNLRAIDITPDDPTPYLGLANAYARLGQKDKAAEYAAKYKTLRTEAETDLVRRRTVANDRVWVARILAQTLTEAGVVYAGNGNRQKAEQCWRRAQTLDPRNRECRQYLMTLFRATGRLREALEVAEQLRAMVPRNPTYNLNAGVLFAELQQYDAAEEAMRKSIEMAPKRPGAYFSLATLLLLWGRNLPEARTLCQELVALEPTARNYALLAEACKRNEDIAGARAALERAMELDPGNQDFKGAYKALSERK